MAMKWPAYFDEFTQRFGLESRTTALLPVDLQYATASRSEGFGALLASQGRLEEADYRFSRIERFVVPNTARLLEAFRRVGAPVIYLTLGCERSDCLDAPAHLRALLRATNNVKGSRAHDILDELKPRADELVLNKRTQGAFASTALETVLRSLGAEAVVLTGVSTNMCVDATARGASDLGFNTVIVSDATGTCSDAMQDATMLTFSRLWGRVMTTDDVIAELGA